MAISLTHTTVAVGTDAGNGEIAKAQWNENHTLTMAGGGTILGRTTAGTGAVEELTEITLASGTKTASAPVMDMTQTWNNAAVTFTGYKFNVTDTASGASSLLMDLQVGGSTKLKVSKAGRITSDDGGFFNPSLSGMFASGAVTLLYANGTTTAAITQSGFTIGSSVYDTILTRRGAANLRFGAADAAAPVAQTLSVQSVVAGTSNTAGANLTITGSQGTGTGAGGDLIVNVAPAGTTGTAQNALTQAFRVHSTKTVTAGAAFTVATLPAAGTQGRRAWVTDATAPTFLGTLTGGGSVVCPVFDNGTAWVAG